MRIHFHRFLLMLLMLALPVQTFASATMLGCAFSDQATAEAIPMAMADGMMAGCHEPEHPDNPPAQHDCSHCAACALASVLPIPISESIAVVPLSIRFVSPPAVSFSGFVPSGPERPPRRFFA